VIRTTNAPAGDYAEWVVQRATMGELAPNSQSSWDLETPDGKHLAFAPRFEPGHQARCYSQPLRSPSASSPCGSEPYTVTVSPTSAQSTSGGYGGTQPE